MAKITPIDVIKGITGKYGSGSNDYFATNKSSNKIHLAKMTNPYKGPASEKQLAQQSKFAARQAAVSAWLNANKPSEKNGAKGTEAYQLAQKLKKTMHFSCISQVIYKHLDEEGTVKLPTSPQPSPKENESPKAAVFSSSTQQQILKSYIFFKKTFYSIIF